MARPLVTVATIVPFLRGEALSVRWSFRGLKYRTPILAKVAEEHISQSGYVKPTHPEYLEINAAIDTAVTCLGKATELMIQEDVITVDAITRLYKHFADKAAKQLHNRKMIAVVKPVALSVADKEMLDNHKDNDTIIKELEKELEERKKQQLLERRAFSTNKEDLLTHYLKLYTKRKGSSTMEDSTNRSFNSFIKTVSRFDADAIISEIDDNWLVRFQDWLIETPSKTDIYSFVTVDGKQVKDKLIRTDEGKPRLNSSIENYITKIKSCLKYYAARPELLQHGLTISDRYKRFEFDLPMNDDNVIAIEENELADIYNFNSFKKKAQEKARDLFVFQCSTGLRFSDAIKVTGVDIKDGVIHLIAKKTKKLTIKVDIPLNPISAAILEKYDYDMTKLSMKDSYYNLMLKQVLNDNDGKTFPTLQIKEKLTKNSGRKDVGRTDTRANLITSHSGRRTFINILLDYNVPLNKLVGITGHLDIKTLMVYANKRKNVKKYLVNTFLLPVATEEVDYSLDVTESSF